MINDEQAEKMYLDLRDKLGRRKALSCTALSRRGISERDLFRCRLPNRVKAGIELMHEKYVQGRDRIAEAQTEYHTKSESDALPDLDLDRVCKS